MQGFPQSPIEEKFLTEDRLDTNHSLKKILQFVGVRKIVLDLGCSSGHLAKMLRERECSIAGIDIDPDRAKIAEQFCDRVFVADLDSTNLPELFDPEEDRFDIIIFGDILEHLKNPQKILESAKELLKEEGYAIASIPNIAHGAVRLALLQGKFEYTPLGILDRTHLRFFTRQSVEELFQKAGYAIESIDTTKLDIDSGSSLLPSFDINAVSPSILNLIRQDPDVDTCQFIVKAFPLLSQDREEVLLKKLAQKERELEQLKRVLQELENSKIWKFFNFLKKLKQKVKM